MSQTRIKIKKNKKRADKPRRSARYWMAVGTMAAYTTFSGDALLKLHAQQDRSAPTVQASGQTQGLTVRHFDIPPGTLEVVLAAYERTVQFHVTVPRDSMRGIWSPGVAGLYTPQAALEKLLAGTGIGFRLTGPDKATLEIQGMATAIDVTAPTVEDTLPLLTQPLIDTPQSIDVVPQHVIQDQGATTLRDTLRNVAGISLAAGEGGAQGDSLTIRGFTARNDIFLDGMRDFGSYYRDPFNMQEVAVLQGPSSVAFGRGSTGGVVNQETKVAQMGRILSGDVELGTDQTKRITADIDRAVAFPRVRDSFPPEPHGSRFEVCRARHCGKPPIRDRPVVGLRTGYTDAADIQLPAPGRRRHARLWHSLAVQRSGPGRAPQLLRLSTWQLSEDQCGHGHGEVRARLSTATSPSATRPVTRTTIATFASPKRRSTRPRLDARSARHAARTRSRSIATRSQSIVWKPSCKNRST